MDWQAGHVEQAIFLAFSVEFLQVAQDGVGTYTPLHFPVCFCKKRIPFLTQKEGKLVPGTSPTHASCFIYVYPHGMKVDEAERAFTKAFGHWGRVMVPPR